MAKPHEKLAESLEVLKKFQDEGITAIKSSALTRTHKERLLKNGFLKEVTKGWLIATPSNENKGDSTSWYISYWAFCADYLNARYGDDYILSPDQSISIHIGNLTVPQQLIVRTTRVSNDNITLPHNTGLFSWQSPIPARAEITIVNGMRMMTLESSLVFCTPSAFTKNKTDIRVALSTLRDTSAVLRILLEGGHTIIAGRLAGALRNIGKAKFADEIVSAMQAADYKVRETDPFDTPSPILFSSRDRSPYVNRIKMMWAEMRSRVIAVFPVAPGLPKDPQQYMKEVDEIYVTDAYHSLSIERYKVSPELIAKVKNGTWNAQDDREDKDHIHAMAASGYYQTSLKVRASIQKILAGENAGKVADMDHGEWYRTMFSPGVAAGIIKASDLAGYRNNQVYIGGSLHVPINPDGVRDTMPALMQLLEEEPEASVRAVLGHFIFVYIHPYMDGNGRIGRFLMNTMLASGGYPWTVIPVEQRDVYMQALEAASVKQDIEPFAHFVSDLVRATMNGKPMASI